MHPAYVIAGQLRREYLLPLNGPPRVDVPGGNLLYAAAGARLWAQSIGLLARVGEDYPRAWLRDFEALGLQTHGIRIMPETIDLREFTAYVGGFVPQHTSPVSHFARLGLTFPKSLLGYQPPASQQDKRAEANPDSPRLLDIPPDYLNARGVLLCPLDFLTHTQLAPAFRQHQSPPVVIAPVAGYMLPTFLEPVRAMLMGVTAFLPSEEELQSLFWGRSYDLWAMMESLAESGCEIIVTRRRGFGQLVYDAASRKRWEIPAYPARVVDPTGAEQAYCGGFLVGYLESFDPLRAALYASVSASLAVEGSGAFYALDAAPGFARARLQSLAEMVRQI